MVKSAAGVHKHQWPVCPDDGPYSMPTAIILPNGLTYTFQYDSCGMLRKVTYPTGGYTRYDYTAEPLTYECLGGADQMRATSNITKTRLSPNTSVPSRP